ncbi:MAG: tyrosine-type recombinase/integrase [Chthoniobacteraceae bacterium]
MSLGTSDKQVAEQRLRAIIKEREQEAAGILAPKRLRDAASDALEHHLRDYVADLTAQKRDTSYIYNVEKRLSKLASEAGWKQLRDVTPDSFQAWRARQSAAAKTLNDYLAAASAFFHWMECNGRVLCNPLKLVRKVEERGNERRKRRAFTVEEMNRLLGVSGARQVGYLAAFFTGLRRAELEQLQWGDVHLEADPPFLSVRASTTKNHKRADIVLHPQLESELRALHPAEPKAGDLVFPAGCIPAMETMRKDLAAAGIAYKDDQARQADFHALRGSLCTHLAVHGIDPHTRKEIMRHSELSLTLKNYTDVRQLKTSEAIRVLPAFIPEKRALPCALVLGAEGHNVARAGMEASEINPAEVAHFEGNRPDLTRTGTAGRRDENGCLTRTRT